jgi:hypothetical protein
MIRMEFSADDIMALKHERFCHPDTRVQRRMEVLLLKAHGLPHDQIQNISGTCGNSMRRYFRIYQDGGIEKLKQMNYYRPQSELTHYKGTLEGHFHAHPVASIPEAIVRIEELTGIRRGPTQTRKFLKSTGMRRLKVGTIPSKADPDEQERFKNEELEPRIAEAKAGKRILFFVDTSCFMRIWEFFGVSPESSSRLLQGENV